jgi:predicted transcriptional regulator
MSPKNSTRQQDSVVLAFLSGRGPTPLPSNKRGPAGRLQKQFLAGASQEIAEQDKANQRLPAPSVVDDLMAVMRLVSDNHEMIQLIQGRKVATVSDLATALGRELPNVSRTLSRMAAYGLVGFDGSAHDARSKRPVWLLHEVSPAGEDLDWVQAYCLARAVKARASGGTIGDLPTLEKAVRGLVESTARKLERAAAAP